MHNMKKCCNTQDYLRIASEEGISISQDAKRVLQMCLQYEEKDRCSLQDLVYDPYFNLSKPLNLSRSMARSHSASDIFHECNTGEEMLESSLLNQS